MTVIVTGAQYLQPIGTPAYIFFVFENSYVLERPIHKPLKNNDKHLRSTFRYLEIIFLASRDHVFGN
ncbi:hypothetical protein TUM3794_20500 [Shewanella colwelliana]|uniref:Uncharacterized protein n=1 Tax=Shewanella colwelliana TaxID=23 RepID=A0ABQ4P0L5_SHECO|nr:hypothetical protein TUM3794_20500 [Shewanella colwelliana]